MADTLDKAVNDAVDKNVPEVETPEKESSEESSEATPTETEEGDEDSEDVDDEGKDDEGDEDDEWNETNLVNAKNLYKALQDPKTAQNVIQALAQQAGLLKTSQDVKEAKDVILDVLQDSLGSEFNFLAPKLSVAIKRILDMERHGFRQALQVEAQERAKIQLSNEIESTLSRLRKETKGESKHLEGRMTELMDELPIGKGVSTDRYLRHLYKIASAENIDKTAKRKLAAKINQNANDAGSRLSAGGAKGSGVQGKQPDGKFTLDQAVQYALESVNIK